ncbi:histidinol-phosphate transaminase [Anaeroselena agilis]|uniref:Histidinol-phosphate aminotransferase n=1 Tax=Anaeroselena agilis TaxID=3063788 RepID=A0ABU3NTQ9_9FIRM|nr:histidinol-phosphate transaminase [Selenomonadales bacterium 4137-cl]
MWQIRPGLDTLKSYHVPDIAWPVKLDANERAEAPPPAVQAAIAERLAAVAANRYPEIGQHSLKQALANGLRLEPENIVLGNGSSEVLAAICRVFGGPGRKIVQPSPSFSMYPIYCKLADSVPLTVELDAGFALAPEKVLATALKEQAALIILCNPNNPTGGAMAPEAVEYIVAGARCPVVVDEAYGEFSGQSALPLLGKYRNLIVARTFSKAYGLAAARVGYAAGDREIIAAIGKVLLPYNLNAFSLAAAQAAWEMRGEFAPGIAGTVAERERLAIALRELPAVEVFPSATNFLLVRTGRAKALAEYLAARGVGVRDFSAAPSLAGCLRITVGTGAENDALLAATGKFLHGEV